MLSGVTTETDHNVRLNDRISLRYKQTGSGEPLVLLHTIRTQLDYFDKIVPILARHFTVYAVDLPGHGYSSIDTHAAYDDPYFVEHGRGSYVSTSNYRKPRRSCWDPY